MRFSLVFKYSDVLPEFSRRCSHQVLFSAVELGIIDLLAQAGGGPSGGLTGEQVAQGIQLMGGSSSGSRAEGGGVGTPAPAPATEPLSNVDSVSRLLDACVAVGLVAVVAPVADGLGDDRVGVPSPQRDGGAGVGGDTDQRDGASAVATPLNGRSRGGGNEIGGIGASTLAPEPMTLQRRPRRYRLTPVSERYLTSGSTSSLAGGPVWVCLAHSFSPFQHISLPPSPTCNLPISLCRPVLPPYAGYVQNILPLPLAGYVVHSSRTCYPLFQQLEGCVRGGHNGWQAAFGMSGAEVGRHSLGRIELGLFADWAIGAVQWKCGQHNLCCIFGCVIQTVVGYWPAIFWKLVTHRFTLAHTCISGVRQHLRH